ncbi:MAG: glycosyltransferase, partial [Paenisporosarcina sp.]
MTQDKVMILDMPIDNMSKHKLLDIVDKELELQEKNLFIVTANPEIIMSAKKSPSYKNSVLQADFIVPDGSGVMMA